MNRVITGMAIMLSSLGPALPCVLAQGDSTIGGVVRDVHGTPQMGALIELMGADATVLARTYTDDHGRYVLGALTPGHYAIRASAAFLLPAIRTNLSLQPGMRALANLTMTAMMEAGNWFPTRPRALDEPSDDWRWTLRSAANRPLLRAVGEDDSTTSSSTSNAEQPSFGEVQEHLSLMAGSGLFAQSGTHQVLTLGAGNDRGRTKILQANLGQPGLDGEVSTLDLHTEIGRATKLLGGESRLVAGFSEHPEIASAGGAGLQAFSLASGEKMALGDVVMIDAGTLLTAEHLAASRVSTAPYLRVVVATNDEFAVMYRFASQRELQSFADLDHVQAAPELLGDTDGRALHSADRHQEVAIVHRAGRDAETFTLYQDKLQFAPVEGLGATATLPLAGIPIVADTSTGNFRLAEKGYTSRGIRTSWTHEVGSQLKATLTAEVGSALNSRGTQAAPLLLDSLGDGLEVRLTPAIEATAEGTILRSGTTYRVQYRWQPTATVDTVDPYNTPENSAYLSCQLRQKLWSGHRLEGFDAVLEATNLLEEGYQPMLGPDGQTLILAQVPRTLQAGLAFSF